MKMDWKKMCICSFLGGLTFCSSCRLVDKNDLDTRTVASLDIPCFMGKWYEIARYEHRFERDMTHVTAEYTLLPEGKIRVLNKGIKDGKIKEIVGKAKQPDPEHYPGRLKVSFFLWFYADYYVLEIDDDYQYAIIGSSSDKYLWILSRTPQLPSMIMDKLLRNIEARGYDLSRLVLVEQ